MLNPSGNPNLILTPRYTADSQALWRAGAYELGWDVTRLHSSDLVTYSEGRIPKGLEEIQPVIYVEALYAPMIATAHGIKLDEPPEDFLVKLPFKFRKREIMHGLFGNFSFTEAAFIKPPNFKSFPAKVYSPDALPDILSDETVLVSEPVHFEMEFRFFIADRQVYAHSLYARNGKSQYENLYMRTSEEDYEASDFVQDILNSDIEIPDPIVMDVGRIKDKGWAVVELNAPWGSGIYDCDPVQILEVLRKEQCK